jgi:hypothetical protein
LIREPRANGAAFPPVSCSAYTFAAVDLCRRRAESPWTGPVLRSQDKVNVVRAICRWLIGCLHTVRKMTLRRWSTVEHTTARRQLAIYCSVPTALHLKSGPVVCLDRFTGKARDDAQAVEVQQFGRQTTTDGLGLSNCRTTTAGPMSRPFSSKTKSRYRFMAAQSKNAGLTSLKTAAVDMESHMVARVAAKHKLAFAALRVVVDAAHRVVPPVALINMRPAGRMFRPCCATSHRGHHSFRHWHASRQTPSPPAPQ